MRVIAGLYKGTKLLSPVGEVRPTTDLVKGSLFSMLDSRGLLRGAKCLDVFCGSGALGIEALSRGAASCVFVDADTKNVRANLDKLSLDCRVLRGVFRRELALLKGEAFDLVFCDPPYMRGFAEEAVALLLKFDMLSPKGVITVEHSSKNDLKKIPGTCIMDKRSFGAAAFDILRGESESDNSGSV